MLRINNIRAGYGNKAIIDDISFNLEKGDIAVIVGRNGCGKSTLLKTIVRETHIESGEIFIDNVDLQKISRKDIALNIAFVEQDLSSEIEFTALQYTMLGRTPHNSIFKLNDSKKDVEAALLALKTTNCEHLRDTPVNKLSGGEKQLVMIAKAIAQDTPIIILDEPTSNLDITNQLEIINLLKELKNQGKTIIAVIHDINVAIGIADRLIMMKNGKIFKITEPQDTQNSQYLSAVLDTEMEKIDVENENKQIIVAKKLLK